MTKTYILDTNVLVHDPDCIFKFEENNIVIPMTVIEELDDLKERRNSVSPDARAASRNIWDVLEGKKSIGGFLNVESRVDRGSTSVLKECNDNRILRTALLIHKNSPWAIMVTKDTNVKIKAKALGLEVEDYRNDQVDRDIKGTCLTLNLFDTRLEYGWSDDHEAAYWPLEGIKSLTGADPSCINYVCSGEEVFKAFTKDGAFMVDTVSPLSSSIGSIKPRNNEQRLAMAALQDDNDFVCLEGPAGSGKTFLALAYGLDQVMEKNRYKAIVVLRSSDSNSIGFLPGTEEEKMLPWMQGFIDNLEVLVGNDNPKATSSTIQHVIEKANIKFRSLDLVRGRSYQDTLIIVDEAQNNTRHQLKAVLTRVGEGSKLIMLGNLAQIDTPYLNERTSGLKHVCAKMPGFKRGAICVFRDIQRSRLTKYAEENL